MSPGSPHGPTSGVVLAAGFGSRLRADEDAAIKPLTPVGGIPLLHRALRSLELAGCAHIVVVGGFRADDLRRAMDGYVGSARLELVINDRFALANGVSVLTAGPHVGDRFVLTMADHVLGDDLMALARECEPPSGGATLLVDRRIAEVFDLDDATKVRTDAQGRIVAIGKTLTDYDAVDTGVFVCTRGLLSALDEVLQRRGDASLSEGVGALAAAGRMHTLDIGQCFWQDVDTPEMLAHADAWLRDHGRD